MTMFYWTITAHEMSGVHTPSSSLLSDNRIIILIHPLPTFICCCYLWLLFYLFIYLFIFFLFILLYRINKMAEVITEQQQPSMPVPGAISTGAILHIQEDSNLSVASPASTFANDDVDTLLRYVYTWMDVRWMHCISVCMLVYCWCVDVYCWCVLLMCIVCLCIVDVYCWCVDVYCWCVLYACVLLMCIVCLCIVDVYCWYILYACVLLMCIVDVYCMLVHCWYVLLMCWCVLLMYIVCLCIVDVYCMWLSEKFLSCLILMLVKVD